MNEKIQLLKKKGVRFTHPESVEIGPEVDVERISGQGVLIYGGCRIYGKTTCIADHAVLGEEGPTTVVDCRVGSRVRLKGGYLKGAVFLTGASVGCGAHVREGTILEEEASGAHTVGLKQTILFPFVTLGSLINFCDCLMAGGTSRKDHSEVGSSYIHFNYTPYQDKATPSLLGDVPRGVMLNQRPLFLGGQGGLVGPSRLAFGTVIAAGAICRKDVLKPNRLIMVAAPRNADREFKTAPFRPAKRIIANNVIYLANLMALFQWYRNARRLFVSDLFSEALHAGLMENLDLTLNERIGRLKAYFLKTAERQSQAKWNAFEKAVEALRGFTGSTQPMERFLAAFETSAKQCHRDYVASIKHLDESSRTAGTAWLQEIVDVAVNRLGTPLSPGKKDKGR